MGSQIDRQEVIDTYAELIKRLYQKKEDILTATNRIVQLTQESKATVQSITEIKQEMNVIVECLSELKPHASNPRLIQFFNEEAHMLLLSTPLLDAPDDLRWFTLTHQVQQLCISANEVCITPTKKSLESALGIKIGKDWVHIEALLHKKTSNH